MGWVTVQDDDGVYHHVLLDEGQQRGIGPHGESPRVRKGIELPKNERERRLTAIVFNETGGLSASTDHGAGSAEDLHNAREAAAEVSNRLVANGKSSRVASGEIYDGLWRGLSGGDAGSVSAWNDSLRAARAALGGSNTTAGASHFRLNAKSGTIPPLGEGTNTFASVRPIP